MPYRTRPRRRPRRHALITLALLLSLLTPAAPALAEGSADLWPVGESGFRAGLEWRTSIYGPPSLNLRRRTLLKVYAEANEYILVGSTAIDVGEIGGGTPNRGDILIFNPGLVQGPIGSETVPGLGAFLNDPERPGAYANGFSCLRMRDDDRYRERGRIATRQQELAGPDTEDGDRPAGYKPCFYRAPVGGIYNVVLIGPSGANSNAEGRPTGRVEWDGNNYNDAGAGQRTAITAWDVTVRDSLTEPAAQTGRLFAYYYTGFTGNNGRTVESTSFVVTRDGFVYEVQHGSDPFGFVYYVNNSGYRNTDGTPLYRNVMADPSLPFEQQNQLFELQGDVGFFAPEYPISINRLAPETLRALGLPTEPRPPNIVGFGFTGTLGLTTTLVGLGGTFRFTTAQPGNYAMVISRDGSNFDPTNPANRLILGQASVPGEVVLVWDGLDNDEMPFPVGEYLARIAVRGGEVHFPFIDVENNPLGGPLITLLNPPDRNGDGVGDCPPFAGGCRGAFYDDRGYETASNVLVGTAVNGPLCPNNVGNPPNPLYTDPVFGFDTFTRQRRFGFLSGGNPPNICDPRGGFGDKKGLDIWTYYPSNVLATPLRIVAPTAVTLLSFSAAHEGGRVVVRWTTALETQSYGFHLYRSRTDRRADALRVTSTLIPARGPQGAAYSFVDSSAAPGQAYRYWLQEVELSGQTNEYGPAALARSGASGTRLLLPLVRG